MKKWMGSIVTIILVIGLLVACGGKSTETNSSADDVTEEIQQPDELKTRIYTDTIGREVEIPINPQRVVTVNMTAEVIALGLKPVGAADNWLNSLSDEQKEGIESVGAATSLNLEKILELEPDLIITFEKVTDGDKLESLSKIAPTVIGPFFGDSMENLRTIGDMLGRAEAAEVWIRAYEEKVKQTKATLKTLVPEGKTALVLLLSSAKTMTVFPISTWSTVYEVLGLQLPDDPELAGITVGQQIPLEKLTEYDPEYIFITSNDDEQMQQYQQELTSSSVWQQLSAAKNHRVYSLGQRITTSDVLALEWALDEIVQAVEKR